MPVLAPAVLASIALVFVETMSDFGVASTLAFQSHFTMATYGIYEAIDNNPAQFGVAAVLSILLLASAALPLALQSRVTRGRSYAILSGRTRPATRAPVGTPGAAGRSTMRRRPVLLPGAGRSRSGRLHRLVRGATWAVPVGAHALTLGAYREVFSGSIAYGHSIAEGATGLSGACAAVHRTGRHHRHRHRRPRPGRGPPAGHTAGRGGSPGPATCSCWARSPCPASSSAPATSSPSTCPCQPVRP